MTTRVVFFDAYPHTAGGVARMCLLVAAAAAHQGRSFEVVVPSDGPAVQVYREAGIPVQLVVAPQGLRRYGRRSLRGFAAAEAALLLPGYWLRLRRALAGADLVHVNDFRGLIVAGPAARFAGSSLVWQVHSQISSPIAGRLARLLGATVAVVNASVTPPGLRRETTVRVVPNAVGADHLPAPAEADGGVPIVLCVARIYPEKGIDVLVDASARLCAAGVQHRVVVVGGEQEGYDDYLIGLRKQVDALGLAGTVELVGEVADVRPWFGRATLYVQPSRREAFGLAVLEAMHAGLPVVASDIGGLPELVANDATGRLVPADDPDALATALAQLLRDPSLRRDWGQAGRHRAESQFGEAQFRTAVRDLYDAATVRA